MKKITKHRSKGLIEKETAERLIERYSEFFA